MSDHGRWSRSSTSGSSFRSRSERGGTVILTGWQFDEPGTLAVPAFTPTYPVSAAVKVWALTPTGPMTFAQR
jgi:hypothetical protein